ncbi:MAG: DUF1080 domain-containing protein, partial [Candidatus Hydrogenedentes bacterium]|nr:DUF1080 domain-containing protein [Candidatus Hydrogenedentota bacterium]
YIPAPESADNLFNGTDLTGWQGNAPYWSVVDGAIRGHSDDKVPRNEFIWFDEPVQDFYLSVLVRLEPDERNSGVQFRSEKATAHGQARGYQADIGKEVWGRLYHEHGRGQLDWTDKGESAVKPNDWNRYEILAIGPCIWTAINGTLSVALYDPEGEREGRIALQIHSGPPLTVQFRPERLVRNPEAALAGLGREELLAALHR